jgi:hypothetical protein
VAVAEEQILYQQYQEEAEAEEMAAHLDTLKAYTQRLELQTLAVVAAVEQVIITPAIPRRTKLDMLEAQVLFT